MRTAENSVEEVKVTPLELLLLLAVRSKFKGCKGCVSKLIGFVNHLEIKDGVHHDS